MCGICGIAGEGADAAVPPLERMLAALRHRGPDDSGWLAAPGVALGSRRLRIIDLPGGRQPMTGEDGRVVVIFNGEITNFQELRRELEGRGHRFRTRSDTETIVHAYEEWGEECAGRLDGMFAFAVAEFADGEHRNPLRLFLARDRLGIKPLYYTQSGGAFAFASEVRALLASGLVESRIAPAGVATYLLFGSLGEPGSLIEGVESLPPAHQILLRLDVAGEAIEPRAYWRLAARARERGESGPKTYEDVVEGTRERLERAVKSHLVSDVPLGVFLSGGIDSTALTTLAARERGELHTFTLGFREREYSEADTALETARRLGTRHQEYLLSGDEALACHREALLSLDQPSMDGINTYFISRAAREAGLKVALSGLGGDELFGGYETFRSAPSSAWLGRKLPRAAAPLVEAAAAALGRADRGRKLASLLRDPGRFPHPYFFTRMLFPPEQVERLLGGSGGFAGGKWREDTAGEAASFDDFSQVSQLEIRNYMVNTLLRDTDSTSMAHSLEVRVPLLDRELVEYVVSLPERWKKEGGGQKPLLIHALAGLLPATVLREPKRTFTLPWERWLRGPLKKEIENALAEPARSLEPFFNSAAAGEVWRDFLRRRTSWSRPWSLFVLNEWTKRYVDPQRGAERHGTTPAVRESRGGAS